jgi:hypothetical protein
MKYNTIIMTTHSSMSTLSITYTSLYNLLGEGLYAIRP